MPGHSRGSISLHDRENKLLFSGDVVYDGSMIDWLPYSRVSDYIGSCERLVGLVDSEQVTDAQTNWSIYSSQTHFYRQLNDTYPFVLEEILL